MHSNGLSQRGAARLALVLVFAGAGMGVGLAAQYERAPTFTAGAVLPPSLLKSRYYKIQNSVGVEDYQYVFNVETRWGTFRIKGTTLFRVRAREMAATAKLEEIGAPRPSSARRDARRLNRSGPPRA